MQQQQQQQQQHKYLLQVWSAGCSVCLQLENSRTEDDVKELERLLWHQARSMFQMQATLGHASSAIITDETHFARDRESPERIYSWLVRAGSEARASAPSRSDRSRPPHVAHQHSVCMADAVELHRRVLHDAIIPEPRVRETAAPTCEYSEYAEPPRPPVSTPGTRTALHPSERFVSQRSRPVPPRNAVAPRMQASTPAHDIWKEQAEAANPARARDVESWAMSEAARLGPDASALQA